MTPDDVLGVMFLIEALCVLWSVLMMFAALRTALWCCTRPVRVVRFAP